jgi:DNA-directed RNA polymerase subunit N (RpoN/RPB10)
LAGNHSRWPLIILLFLSSLIAAHAEKCGVCGEEITGENFYIFTDHVSNEKKHLCYACSVLPDQCFVCGMPVKKDFTKLPDGRVLCARDVKNAVLDSAEAKRHCAEVSDELDRLFSRFTSFPTNVDVSVVDRVNLLALFKVPGNDFDCPDVQGYFRPHTNHSIVRYQISLMSALPRADLRATCAHELSHAWVAENVPAERREKLKGDGEEGFCELISYLVMDAEQEEAEKKAILENNYTRGQIDLFIAAERAHGLNDVLDWMKWGTADELSAEEPNRIREIEIPRGKSAVVVTPYARVVAPRSIPDTLILKGISGTPGHAFALINDQTIAVGESARVRVGKTNVVVRCLEIKDDTARIQIVGSTEEQRLSLRKLPD